MSQEASKHADVKIVLNERIDKINSAMARLKVFMEKSESVKQIYQMGYTYILTLEQLQVIVQQKGGLSIKDMDSLTETLDEAQSVITLSEHALQKLEKNE